MTYTIFYHGDAQDDLFQIALFYAQKAGVEKAQAILDDIKTQIQSLQIHPERCMVYPRLPIYRRLLIQKLPYWVYFLMHDNQVWIVRILHTSRNHNHFFNQPKESKP